MTNYYNTRTTHYLTIRYAREIQRIDTVSALTEQIDYIQILNHTALYKISFLTS